MNAFQFDIINQAFTNLFIGLGLALVNLIVRYFVPVAPDVVTILRWPRLKRAVIASYLIALVLQMATSPIFRAWNVSTAYELAWSPYQAIWNVLGVVIMDVIMGAWSGVRRGATLGRQQIEHVRDLAADQLEELGAQLPFGDDGSETQPARRKAEAEAEAQAKRKERLDDRLKDY